MKAARYLGVPPWDLAERPSLWMHWAITAMAAEAEAEAARIERASSKQGKSSP